MNHFGWLCGVVLMIVGGGLVLAGSGTPTEGTPAWAPLLVAIAGFVVAFLGNTLREWSGGAPVSWTGWPKGF